MAELRAGTRRAWLEVDVAALARNAAVLGERIGRARLLPMVKAEGYGLGALRTVRALRAVEPWGFGVATAEEGAELRAAGVAERIVVFFPCAALDAPALARDGLEGAVSSLDALEAYAEHASAAGPSGGVLTLHLEIDTGMGRSGLPDRSAETWIPRVAERLGTDGLRLVGTFTHFHSAEEDAEATRRQWERFRSVLDRMRAEGLNPGLVHAGNSAVAVLGPPLEADLARPGIYLYGGAPGRMADATPAPEPVARLRARVLDVREVEAGATVSYGATWTAPRPARLATLGIGYGDGLPHALSNRGSAIIEGRRVPIVGRVCMDVTVVDVTGAGEVRPGSVATLLGREGDEEIGLTEMARLCETIEYELLTGFGARLPRVEVRSTAPEAPEGGPDAAAVEGGSEVLGARG